MGDWVRETHSRVSLCAAAAFIIDLRPTFISRRILSAHISEKIENWERKYSHNLTPPTVSLSPFLSLTWLQFFCGIFILSRTQTETWGCVGWLLIKVRLWMRWKLIGKYNNKINFCFTRVEWHRKWNLEIFVKGNFFRKHFLMFFLKIFFCERWITMSCQIFQHFFLKRNFWDFYCFKND